MKNKWTYRTLILLTVLNLSCRTDNKDKTSTIDGKNDLTDKLNSIRQNLQQINAISKWDSSQFKELYSTEGGGADFYYRNGRVEKIVKYLMGETFRLSAEYYVLNRQLSFVFEKTTRYNRPMYWDSTVMKENDDTELFDITKSEITEDSSFFENGRLIHRISNQDGSFEKKYLLEEEARIKTDFEELLSIEKNEN